MNKVEGVSADGNVDISFNIFSFGSTTYGKVIAGEYPVMVWAGPAPQQNFLSADSRILGNSLDSGKLVVTDNADGTQTFSYEIKDELGTTHKGEYTGVVAK